MKSPYKRNSIKRSSVKRSSVKRRSVKRKTLRKKYKGTGIDKKKLLTDLFSGDEETIKKSVLTINLFYTTKEVFDYIENYIKT